MTTLALDVDLLRAGDPQMTKLFLAVVRRRTRRYFRSKEQAESAANEAFLEMLTKLDRGEQPEHAGQFAITAASNAARRLLNRRRGMIEFESELHSGRELASLSELHERGLTLDHVAQMIARLPEHLQTAILETAAEGRTIQSVAKELGVPAATLRKQLVRTREKFTRELSKGEKLERLYELGRQVRRSQVDRS